MNLFKHFSLRWTILAVAFLGVGVYLVAPLFGWGFVLPFLQVPNQLFADQETQVFGRFEWSDEITVVPDEFRHLTLDLNYHDSWYPAESEVSLLQTEGPVMITVRTWSWKSDSYHDNPLNDVVDGDYDELFRQFLSFLPRDGENVFLRFDPDVEVPVAQYPWQQFPRIFIGAFRRFAELSRELAPQARMVWAAAGYPGAMEFYPGDDVVDAASVTFGYTAEGELDAYPRPATPEADLYRRLHRLRFLRVPVYAVTEDGNTQKLPDLEAVAKKLRSAPAEVYGHPPAGDPDRPEDFRTGDSFVFGLYDPQQRLLSDPVVEAEHLFADFDIIRDGSFDSLFRVAQDRGHATIVSFEPFSRPIEQSDRNVLRNVVGGQYERELTQLFRTLGSARQPVWLRYAHEMEIPITRYPWQSQDPQDYIASWRYVMTHDSLPPAIKRIWGPAGDRGSLEWYPGDDYVDLVSIAIYGLPDKNITDPEQQESFKVIFNRKMWRMRFVSKPVFITEFGVKGPEEYQTRWLEGAAEVLRGDRRVIGVNYFNMSDTPKAWGEIKPPDWSITQATLARFTGLLEARESSGRPLFK